MHRNMGTCIEFIYIIKKKMRAQAFVYVFEVERKLSLCVAVDLPTGHLDDGFLTCVVGDVNLASSRLRSSVGLEQCWSNLTRTIYLAISFNAHSQDDSILVLHLTEWREHYPWGNKPRVHPHETIGDCHMMQAETKLALGTGATVRCGTVSLMEPLT